MAQADFSNLLQDFSRTYLPTPSAQQRLSQLQAARAEAARNFTAISLLSPQDQSFAGAVIQGLLPHADTPTNRAAGAWIHPWPVVGGEQRRWRRFYGNADQSWQRTAQAIWSFIRWCVEDPQDLSAACADFARNPASSGFQAATLSPILNALAPQQFHLVNGRVIQVVHYFSGAVCGLRMSDYPQANEAVQGFLDGHPALIPNDGAPDVRAADLFESFCHWLVRVRRYAFPTTHYWSIRAAGSAEWCAWQEGGFVALAQPQLDDLARLRRREFDQLAAQIATEQAISKRSLQDLWRFAHHVQDGDGLVVEADGQVLGVGTISGHYYHVGDEEAGHCLPVSWDDLQLRAVPQRARQKRTFRELGRSIFAELAAAPPVTESIDTETVPATVSAAEDQDPASRAVKESGPDYRPGPARQRPDSESAGVGVTGETQRRRSPAVSLAEIAEQWGFEADRLYRWVGAIERKGQAIIYGPPGTGKTFLALELARHLAGGGDGFYEILQFHPSYAYEEFVQGLRPVTVEGQLRYQLLPGRFLEFCLAASQHTDRCVLVIDEINRADIARVFGELMHGLEYRSRSMPLAGGGTLTIPANVRLIGTMNTADRSIALLDYALRRRFAFLHLPPDYDVLRRYAAQIGAEALVEPLIDLLVRVNRAIDDPNYALGITFFLRPRLADEIEDIWRTEIEPYLEEYFFDRPAQIEPFRWARVREALER